MPIKFLALTAIIATFEPVSAASGEIDTTSAFMITLSKEKSIVALMKRDGTVSTWNWKDHAIVAKFPLTHHSASPRDTSCLKLSPNGDRLIYCNWLSPRVSSYSATDGAVQWKEGLYPGVSAPFQARFISDGSGIAVSADVPLHVDLLDSGTGELIHRVRDHHEQSYLRGFGISLSGKTTATIGSNCIVRFWETASNKLLEYYYDRTCPTRVEFITERQALIGGSESIRILDLETMEFTQTIKNNFPETNTYSTIDSWDVLAASALVLISGSGSNLEGPCLRIFDTRDGREIKRRCTSRWGQLISDNGRPYLAYIEEDRLLFEPIE